MVSPDGEEIRFIDFEGAVETGVDLPLPMATPGFTSRRLTGRWTPTRADDCYGLGALMFAGVMPVNHVLTLDGRAVERFLDAWRDDLGMPAEYAEVVRGLMHPDPERRRVRLFFVEEFLPYSWAFLPADASLQCSFRGDSNQASAYPRLSGGQPSAYPRLSGGASKRYRTPSVCPPQARSLLDIRAAFWYGAVGREAGLRWL